MELQGLNDELTLTCPDEFQVMSEEEMAGLNVIERGEGICLKAPELHMIISVAWKKNDGIGGLFGRLLSGDDLVRNMESSYQKHMKQYGYSLETYQDKDIGGINAGGLCFSYSAQKTPMTAESYVLRKEKTLYYFHVYYRTQLWEESRRIWNQILDSVRFGQ